MSAALESVTRQRLEEFRRRQQMLQAVRGLALALICAVLVLVAVVAIDAGVVIHQSLRWLLSIAIYGTLAGWLAATLIRVSRRVSLPATARVLEELEPRLQQRLLAAVELSQDEKAARYSSSGFRAMLQQQVARAVAPIRPGDLLPWSILLRVLFAAAVCLTACIGLSFVPGLHWPHRVARALLPGANLGRITRFQIEIVSPNPASTLLPAGDVASIEARVAGPMPDSVTLETRIGSDVEATTMRRVLPNAADRRDPPRGAEVDPVKFAAVQIDPNDLLYAVNLPLGPESIEYRVLVEDAHTPWHRLTTQARPQAIAFRKTIIHPGYSQLSDLKSESVDGDIEALKGSRVRLEVVCDQPIRRAALQLSLPELTSPKEVAMESLNNSTEYGFVAELPVDGDYTYRIDLEASETKFTNAFSRAYQVRALPDMPPRLAWENPETSMLVVEPNQLIPMAIHVEDELPLAELAIISSVNGDQPVAIAIQAPSEAVCSVKCELDLMAIKPRLGDTVRVLFQATDRQGQAVLSTPV